MVHLPILERALDFRLRLTGTEPDNLRYGLALKRLLEGHVELGISLIHGAVK